MAERSPSDLAGEPVVRTLPLETGDGFKFWLADGSWLLVRAWSEQSNPDVFDLYPYASSSPI